LPDNAKHVGGHQKISHFENFNFKRKSFMRNFIFVVVLCLLAFLPAQAQEISKVQVDGWRGLKFDVSTVEDAVKALGKPAKDEANKNVEIISRRGADWLTVSENEKVFRKLTFEKLENFAKARLYFKNDKLAVIEFEAKRVSEEGWLDPDDLTEVVEADFKPHNAVFGGKKLSSPREFAVSGDPSTKDKFHAFYEMVAVSEKFFVFASVDNREPIPVGLFGKNPSYRQNSKAKEKRDKNGDFPGFVREIQIFSRSFSTEAKS
jgi:hypothetical protein